jgi:hypothetical protein
VNRGRKDGLSVYCVPCGRAATNASRLKWRRLAIEALGGKCNSCGFTDERALQVDHVLGGGGALRRSGDYVGSRVFRAIATGTAEHIFQLLCANCNWIKVAENNERGDKRTYDREIPTARIDRPNARWTPEQHAAQSEKTKAMWQDPEKRAVFLANSAEVSKDPRIREIRSKAASENMRKRWASGEVPNRPRAKANE